MPWQRLLRDEGIRQRELMDRVLDSLGLHEIAHGGAAGADFYAGAWAKRRDVRTTVFEADWEMQGKRAGILRNARMLAEFKPHIVVAFPGGRGTADMVTRARRAGVRVVQVDDDEQVKLAVRGSQ
jgi:hypothetical protein